MARSLIYHYYDDDRGKFEWKGDWSDKSDKWTTRLKTKLNVQDIDDGKFWMSFLDFSRHFEDIYICRFFDTANWHATEINVPSIPLPTSPLNPI
jgi:hypothetical protein